MEGRNELETILGYFREVSGIPRCSGNERAISDYLLDFAVNHGIEAFQDESMNVVMKKPATEGYEDAPVVMLQGHMDMVCVKTEDTIHDFESDPIEIIEEDGFLRAAGTTLGADNGIAVAFIMCLMASENISHPALEGVITTAEETGMDGVIGLDVSGLKAEILINLDSEEEGIFLASSAGGVNNVVRLPVNLKKQPQDAVSHEIRIKGLKGGHSGSEIDKRHENAIKLMGRFLSALDSSKFGIAGIKGGSKRNAIADHCGVVVTCLKEDSASLVETAAYVENLFRSEFAAAEPEFEMEMKEVVHEGQIFDSESSEKVADLLRLMPSDVQTMSHGMPGLVESSINLGTIEMEGECVKLTNSIRSSVRSLKDEINGRVDTLCRLLGAYSELDSDYPGWEYSDESFIRGLMTGTYEEMFGEEASVEAIHAGLECGFFKEKMPELDIISMGPAMFDVHSPRERLDMASVDRTWRLIVGTLEKIK